MVEIYGNRMPGKSDTFIQICLQSLKGDVEGTLGTDALNCNAMTRMLDEEKSMQWLIVLLLQ